MISKIIKPFKNFIFWLNCARLYILPITILSWIVIFIYALKHNGNAILGIIALIGISLVHMATNLIDDYVDYKVLVKNEECQKQTKGFKCAYLKNNLVTVKDLRKTIILFLACAALIGLFLFFMSGKDVIFLALIGLIIAISYPKLSQNGLGEIAVIIAYGPLLFEGVYYVMCKTFSIDVLILSFACALFTNTILYTHMLMDFDADKTSHKKTLCLLLKTKNNALNFILVFYITGFLTIGILGIKTNNYAYFLPWLTLPMIIELFNALKKYNQDKNDMPQLHFWHHPIDNWDKIKETSDAPFYFRFLYSRNISTLFMILACIGILFS